MVLMLMIFMERYCYGAPYVCEQLAKGGICTAGAFAHPAFLLESHFEQLESKSIPICMQFSADYEPSEPLFLSCAETDHLFPNESRNHAVNIMQGKGTTFQVQLFSGVEHGFALRGDMSKPYEREQISLIYDIHHRLMRPQVIQWNSPSRAFPSGANFGCQRPRSLVYDQFTVFLQTSKGSASPS